MLIGVPSGNITHASLSTTFCIGGYRHDAISPFLIDKGLTVQTSLQDKENLSKLQKDQIDLWATGDVGGCYMAKQSPLGALKVVHRFNSADLYLGWP